MSSEPKAQAVSTIEEFKVKAEELKKQPNQRYGPSWKRWHRDVQVFLEHTFGAESRHIADFSDIRYSSSFSPVSEQQAQKLWVEGLSNVQAIFDSFIYEINEYGLPKKHQCISEFEIIERLLKKFHLVARQLKNRYGERHTLEIKDEYDVQDLLHSLLKIYFDDIRAEEVCPSWAGGSSRVDFLLKPQRVMIEVKKTRKSLEAKEIGEQLIIDISRYSGHPALDTLICFVYDPEFRISNPKGLAADLEEKSTGNLKVKVLIFPQ